jgi:hypothetical protein
MILSVKDRLVLLGALPEAGDFVTLKVVMELRMELGLSAEEIETIELKQDGTLTRWNVEKDPNKEFKLSKTATGVIEMSLKRLDIEKKLTPDHLALYERFVVGEEEKA